MTARFAVIWTVLTNITHIIVGTFLFALGAGMVWYQMEHPPTQKLFVYIGSGVAAFGTLIIPTVLPIAKQIAVFVFPNGIPLPGGKRLGDPPAPAPPSSGADTK